MPSQSLQSKLSAYSSRPWGLLHFIVIICPTSIEPDIVPVDGQYLLSQGVRHRQAVGHHLQVVLDDEPGARLAVPHTAHRDGLVSEDLQLGGARSGDPPGVEVVHDEGRPVHLGPISHSGESSQPWKM